MPCGRAVAEGPQVTHERTVLLVVHTGRDEATETARRVEKVLGDNGIGLRVLAAGAVDRGSLQLAPDDIRALGVDIEVVDADEHAAEGCELVLVLGGDGTFLRAAELARNAEIPVLGVNLGHIGFLAEAEAEAIDHVLDHVIEQDYEVEERMTLDIAVRVGGQVVQRGWALNEASLEKGTRYGVLERGAGGRRTAGVGIRLRRRAGVRPDRFHRLCVLRRRPDPVAGSGGDPGGAQQRSRFVRPSHGDQSDARRSPSRWRRAATTRWCSATAAGKWWCRPAGGWR